MAKAKGEEVGALDRIVEDGVIIEMERIGTGSKRIKSTIGINASLESIWNVLSDYDKLPDFVPGIAVSKVLHKRDNCCRVHQIGKQNLPFGFKFTAKMVLDNFERELETSATGRKRDIDFKMIEGDFQTYDGKWSIEQFNKKKYVESLGQEFETTLSYYVDVKPKLWMPFHLIEGRLCKEIKTNLSCVRNEAQRLTGSASKA